MKLLNEDYITTTTTTTIKKSIFKKFKNVIVMKIIIDLDVKKNTPVKTMMLLIFINDLTSA